MCIAEYEGDGAEPVVSPSGDGCFEEMPSCVESEGCIEVKYGLPRAVMSAAAQDWGDPLDTIEEQLLEAGCPDDIATVHAEDLDDAATTVADLRRDLEGGGGCGSASSIMLTGGDIADISRLNTIVDSIITMECMTVGPPCTDDSDCAAEPGFPLCIEDRCRPCVIAQDLGRPCEDGFVCNEVSGGCDEVCFLPEVSHEGRCVTCDQIPEPATGDSDAADDACAAAAVAEGTYTSVCDRGAMSCFECTEEKAQACSDDERCDPVSNQCAPKCESNPDCSGVAGSPYCSADGICSPCDRAVDPADGDAACALADEALPVCSADGECVACTPSNTTHCEAQMLPACSDEGECVECTAEDTSRCEEQSFVCDTTNNACVPCTEHSQCASGACELALAEGKCFPEDFVVRVDGDPAAMPIPDFMTIEDAVAMVGDGQHGVIIVHELGSMGFTPYTTDAPGLIVDTEKTIAIIAAPGEQPILQGTGGNPGLRVGNMAMMNGATVYVDGLHIIGNTSGLGLLVEAGATAWVDRSRIAQNAGGGVLAQDGAELVLRNCFTNANNGSSAVTINSSNATIVYSTIFSSAFEPTAALNCLASVTLNLRNSIVVTEGGMPGVEFDCAGENVTYSATEALVPGDGNVSTGSFPDGSSNQWFGNAATGDLSLQNEGVTVFTDIALWRAGDPTTDIDGDPRPTIEGDRDYAGADIP